MFGHRAKNKNYRRKTEEKGEWKEMVDEVGGHVCMCVYRCLYDSQSVNNRHNRIHFHQFNRHVHPLVMPLSKPKGISYT